MTVAKFILTKAVETISYPTLISSARSNFDARETEAQTNVTTNTERINGESADIKFWIVDRMKKRI